MKKIIVFLVYVISANIVFAQEKDENSSLTKKQKRQAETEKQFQQVEKMLENKDFVLQADFLQDRFGHRIQVNQGINFVAVDSAEAIIQVGSDWRIGPNGVGGVTARGHITKWQLTENKKSKSFDLQMSVMTPTGFYDLYFSIGSSGDATADLTGIRPGRLTFDGNLVSWRDSSVFVGQSL